MMKVLLVSPFPPPSGGIATWTKNLLDYFAHHRNGFEIIHQDTSIRSRDFMKVDLWNRVWYGTMETKRILSDLTKNIEIHKPDIIHLTSSASLALIKDYFIIRIARRNKIPLVIHWRFGRIPELAVRQNLEWKLLCKNIKGSNLSIVIDENSFVCLKKREINNIVKVPNPVGIAPGNIFNSESDTLNRRTDSVLFVGHIIKSKGIFELVEACSLLPNVKELILMGSAEEKLMQELKRYASGRRAGNWLKISGPVMNDQVYMTMRSSSILVLPSYTEGFPNVVIEAMSVGCAIIATDVGAIPEILAISTGKPCGICVPAMDPRKLGEAISYLLDNPEKAVMMGRNGIERVMHNYTMDKVMSQYESVWTKAFIDNKYFMAHGFHEDNWVIGKDNLSNF